MLSAAERAFTPEAPRFCTPRKRAPLSSPLAGGPSSCDRFIPNRGAFDLAVSQFEIARRDDAENALLDLNASPAKEEYKRELAETLYAGAALSNRVLAFKATPLRSPRGSRVGASAPASPSLRVLYALNKDALNSPKRYARPVAQMAERILDAPDLIDDFYLNLLDWSAANVLVVALGSSVFLWDHADGSIVKLIGTDAAARAGHSADAAAVTSVAWSPCARRLMVGTARATVELWDAEARKRVGVFEGHSARVGALAWASASGCSSGARSGEIRHHDVRAPAGAVAVSRAHAREVCGLKWSCAAAAGGGLAGGGLGGASGARLASGGSDNCLHVWDERRLERPELALRKHTAAVKALAWAPWQRHLLASGGGANDRMIRFWHGATGQCLHAVDSRSQVCALQWSPHDRELVSSHGCATNQLVLWRYPTMTKLAELSGHTSRVLHLATSPDGTTVASAGADETLRFWKLFNGARTAGAQAIDLKRGIVGGDGGGAARTTIR